MLSRLVLRAAPAVLKGLQGLPPPVCAGVLHVARPLHTAQHRLAPVPPLPEKGGEVRHGLIPEEFFQFLYPKTGVTVLAVGFESICFSHSCYIWLLKQTSHQSPPLIFYDLVRQINRKTPVEKKKPKKKSCLLL